MGFDIKDVDRRPLSRDSTFNVIVQGVGKGFTDLTGWLAETQT